MAQQQPAPHDTLRLPAAKPEGIAPALVTTPAPAQPPLSSAAEPPPSIQINAVEAPTIDGVGTIDDTNGKLTAQIWNASSYENTRPLLSWMHEGVAHPALRDLTLRLLTLRATAPAGAGGNRWFAERLQAIIALGADDKAAEMIAAVPNSMVTTELLQTQAELLLLKGDTGAACATLVNPQVVGASEQPFWQRLNILCKSVSGKRDEAMLALDLFNESSAKDDLFLQEAIYRLSDRTRNIKTLPTHVTLLDVAMLRLTGEMGKLKDRLDSLPPVALKYLATDASLDLKFREKAAGRAIQLGLMQVKEGTRPPVQPFASTLAGDVNALVTSFSTGNAPSAADQATIARLVVDGSAALQDCRRVQRMLALMEPFGYRVPPDVWDKLFTRKGRYDGDMPPAVLIDRLNAAAQAGKKAEVILLSALILGGDDVERTHEAILLPVVRGLLAAGFTQEAHRIAYDALAPYRTH